jgi:hypothetical protein
LVIASLFPAVALEAAVRLSQGGICHTPDSGHYERLKTYKQFSTIEECIRAGGRPPSMSARGSATTVSRENVQGNLAGIAVVMIVLAAGAVGAIWMVRHRGRKSRSLHQAIDDLERRRWEGHRLDSRPLRPADALVARSPSDKEVARKDSNGDQG